MLALSKGRYVARMAVGAADLGAAQGLRARAFGAARDGDAFDAICRHVLVEDRTTGTLVCCFRLLPLASGAAIGGSYSAQFYDLAALAAYPGAMLEIGRFCTHPDWHDPDIVRMAWGALTRLVDAGGARMLFGCSSFQGTRAEAYREAFGLLAAGHLAPPQWRPRVKAPDVVRFAETPRRCPPDLRRGLQEMPPLLRSYLAIGGWVSDHAVVDRDLSTLHVFTALEISAIPPARAKALRAVAGG